MATAKHEKEPPAKTKEVASPTPETLSGTSKAHEHHAIASRNVGTLHGNEARQAVERTPAESIEEIKLCVDGKESIYKMIDMIKSAKKKVEITMFIWADDETGARVLDAVYKKAKEGVTVVIRKDRYAQIFEHSRGEGVFHKDGRTFTEWLLNDLMSGKLQVPPQPMTKERLAELFAMPNVHIEAGVTQDHTKLITTDDEHALLGGMNIDNFSRNELRDFMTYIRSKEFVRHLHARQAGKEEASAQRSVEVFLNGAKRTSPELQEIKPELLRLLDSAKKSIIVEMAFFGDREMSDALVAAAKRGIDVTVITAAVAHTQENLNKRELHHMYYASEKKIKFVLLNWPVHSKVISVDEGRSVAMGSTNFNKTIAGERALGEIELFVRGPKHKEYREKLDHELQIDAKRGKRASEKNLQNFDGVFAYFEDRAAGKDYQPVPRKKAA